MANYTRFENILTIKGGGSDMVQSFESINKAKRESKRLPLDGHSVTVIKHKQFPRPVVRCDRRES
jgi:hypothetical protein